MPEDDLFKRLPSDTHLVTVAVADEAKCNP